MAFASTGALRAVIAALLVFAFAVTALPAEMHRHAAPVLAGVGHHAANACSDEAAPVSDPAELTLSPSDCSLCDFAAALVSPAVQVAPPSAVPHFAEAVAVAPPLRAQPYRPYRFADRSSSRAPPAASLFTA